jgi:two-component system, OmpR family, heavy metal sensor histidine kinase CusS
MPLSIRWRLTLWNVVALAVVLVGFGGLVYGMLATVLYAQLDRTLTAGREQLVGDERLPREPMQRLRHWIGELEEDQNAFTVIYDANGRPLLHSDRLAEADVPPAPAASEAPRFGSMKLHKGGRQRFLTYRVALPDGTFTVLHLTPLAEVDRELRGVLIVLLAAVPVALVFCGGLGYLMARKALRPMDHLHRLTEQITADRLDRRLPFADVNDELGRLARTINAMIGRLQRSFEEIRRFTADASHELRTPLAALRAEAEIALGKPLSEGEHQELLGSILEECDRLGRLTDQLLALSREDARAAPPIREAVDLAALVDGVTETMRPLAEAKGLRLVRGGKGPLNVTGDEARLREVFYNLLDNAIKYTPEGGSVEVEVGQKDGRAVVIVRDTGIGIPAEHLPRVFDRFYRVDKARSRAEGGTGLGLSIARSIVSAHGGRIELDSTPGQGTTCTVVL